MSIPNQGHRVRGLLRAAPALLALLPAALHAEDVKGPSDEPTPAPGEEAAGSDLSSIFRLEITASAWFASLDGWLQTSKGGNAGTTSQHRPKIDEIGLDGIEVLPLVDARFTFFMNHELHVSYASVSQDGSATLDTELISQGQTFPAGSRVSSSFDLDMLRLGYRARWLEPKLGSWTLTPEIGVAWDPSHYKLDSPSATGSVDRSYTIAYPYLGVIFAGPVFGPLRAEVDLAGSAGINGSTFADAELRLVYPIVSLKHFQMDVAAGLKGTWVRREDNQSPQHNDLNVRLGAFSDEPWGGFTVGLRMSF